MTKNKSFLKNWATEFAGLCIGFQILVKAFDKLPYFRHYPLSISFLIFAGLFVTIGSLLHHRLEKHIKHTHALFHCIEGVVMIISALLLFDKGKFRMPAFILFIGCLYIVLGILGYTLNKDNYKRLGRPILRWTGIVLLVFGVVAIGLNWNYDKDPWVFGIAALILLIGAFYSIFTDWILSQMGKFEAAE